MDKFVGTWLEGRICHCHYYRADPEKICYGCAIKHPKVCCEPPGCVNCGKWPPYRAINCKNCNSLSYNWFGYSGNEMGTPFGSRLDAFSTCWTCVKKSAFLRQPHPTTLESHYVVFELL